MSDARRIRCEMKLKNGFKKFLMVEFSLTFGLNFIVKYDVIEFLCTSKLYLIFVFFFFFILII